MSAQSDARPQELLKIWTAWRFARVVGEEGANTPGPLAALEAATELTQRLLAQRWVAIKAAREDGASWEQVGSAMGVSKQRAHQIYTEAIARQEQYVPHHDVAAARAVAGSDDGEPR